jgi:hypothetical protein
MMRLLPQEFKNVNICLVFSYLSFSVDIYVTYRFQSHFEEDKVKHLVYERESEWTRCSPKSPETPDGQYICAKTIAI